MAVRFAYIAPVAIIATTLAAAPAIHAQERTLRDVGPAPYIDCPQTAAPGQPTVFVRVPYSGDQIVDSDVYIIADVNAPKHLNSATPDEIELVQSAAELYAFLTGTLPNDPSLNSGTIVFEDTDVSPFHGNWLPRSVIRECVILDGVSAPRN